MVSTGLILAFMTHFLAVVATGSLREMLPRMIRGMIATGTAGYAAAARGTDSKVPRSEIKNFYNLCKGSRVSVDCLQAALVHLLASQVSGRILIAVDWTDMRDFKMLVFGVVIGRRTIPIFWWTIRWHEGMVKAERSAFEAFNRLMTSWTYIVVADRGFGNAKLLGFLRDELKMSFVIRVKSDLGVRRVESDKFIPLRRIAYTRGRIQDLGRLDFVSSHPLPALRIVRLHDLDQQEPWILATSLDAPAKTIVRIYSTRFLIEEMFKDGKDKSNGFALSGLRFKDPERLSRVFGIWAMAYVFLTLLGLHGMKRGWHQQYQSNSRRRELALFRVGRCIALDKKRGPLVTLGNLSQAIPAMAFRIGHWDWVPRPWEELTEWEVLPAPPKASRSPRTVRTERPCDARLRLRLTELLKKEGITQTKLAQRLDRGSSHVSNTLRGSAPLSQTWFPVLMEVLGFTTIEELIGDTGWTRPLRKYSVRERVPVTEANSRMVPKYTVATEAAPWVETAHEEQRRQRLQTLLKAAGITQLHIAEAINRDQSLVSRVLNGRHHFPAWWLPIIYALLNITEETLMDTTTDSAPLGRESVDGPWIETAHEEQRRQRLKILLKSAGITQKQIAAAVNRDQSLVNKILNGHLRFPAPWLPIIYAQLNITEGELIDTTIDFNPPGGDSVEGPWIETAREKQRRQRLQTLLKAAGITQTQIAKAIDRDQSLVSRVLNGRHRLPVPWLSTICAQLDIAEEALLETAGDEHESCHGLHLELEVAVPASRDTPGSVALGEVQGAATVALVQVGPANKFTPNTRNSDCDWRRGLVMEGERFGPVRSRLLARFAALELNNFIK